MKPRHLLLGAALLASAGLALLPGPEPVDGVVAPVARGARPVPAPAGMPPPSARAARPRFDPGTGADLFPAQSFLPPPSRSVAPPPPPPEAPALPFAYVGAWTENGVETVFLAQGERVLSVRAGERLAGGWRLDTVQPEALAFTYEPLNQPRTLRIAP